MYGEDARHPHRIRKPRDYRVVFDYKKSVPKSFSLRNRFVLLYILFFCSRKEQRHGPGTDVCARYGFIADVITFARESSFAKFFE